MDLLNKITFEMQHTCSEVQRILSYENKMDLTHSSTSTSSSPPSDPRCNLDWFPEIFGDQDDAWIEILLAITDLYVLSKTWYGAQSSLNKLANLLNPHKLFIQLLKSMAFDHCVLLDLLTSPETCFLLYFLKYLKLASQEWCIFVQLHKEYTYVAEYNRSNYSNLLVDDIQSLDSKEETQKHVHVCPDSADKTSYEMKINTEKPQCCLQFSHGCQTKSSASVVHESQIDFNEGPLLTCKHLHEGESEKTKEHKSSYRSSIGLSWIQMYSDSEEESISENSNSNVYTTFGDSPPLYKNIPDSSGDSSIQNVDDLSLPEVLDKSQYNTTEGYYSATNILKSPTDIYTSVQKSNSGKEVDNMNNTEGGMDFDIVSHTTDNTSLKPCQKPSDVCSEASYSVSGALDQTLGCLIRLQLSLERLNRSEVFPYNPEKLIQALQRCIFLYES